MFEGGLLGSWAVLCDNGMLQDCGQPYYSQLVQLSDCPTITAYFALSFPWYHEPVDSVYSKMTFRTVLTLSPVLVLCSLIFTTFAQQSELPTLEELADNFECPEKNGLFPDPLQCDLYYECIAFVPTAIFCENGLIFDNTDVNHALCKLPSEAQNCGDREFLQSATPGDENCPNTNGIFDHPNPDVCDKFYRCDKGKGFEYFCGPGLVFDVAIGSCTFENAVSSRARKCNTDIVKTVDGFACPAESRTSLSHSTHPHPYDCRSFIVCFAGGQPNKFGCQVSQVFDKDNLTCKVPDELQNDPECRCYYECEACRDNDIEDASQEVCDFSDCTCKL